ncbi:MAG TPA: formate dehydrogenase subunit gamma [candidate division Zixibacteria bacterium]|nr:formate dehydrogenase subunit gamma [candidate division Zixibacteria bacterium]
MQKRSRSILWLCVSICLLSAGSLSAQHPAINLLDHNGEVIDPINGENDDQPFSTAMTCGMCHDYEEITSGYHFQMGWDVIADDFGDSTGQPWSLSNGFMGKWYPFAYRQLAHKHNESSDDIDLTVYDFVGFSSSSSNVLPCGACHPGGGGLEYDREGNRYDEYLAENPDLRDSLDGDYYHSNWDKSGVVEADCFVCHFKGYNFDERVTQLKQGNYRWAATAGTMIGFVSGSVKSGREPRVTYNKRFFNDDGTITLDMSGPPPSDNCVFCHGASAVSKRGFTWNDIYNPDVHNQQGVTCIGCHPAGPDHQFAKGDANSSTVADALDNNIKDCKECHYTGFLGASVPRHSSIRPSHLEKISCEGCHIPSLGRAAAVGFDVTSGEQVLYVKPDSVRSIGDRGDWSPTYERRHNKELYPLNSVQGVWWANMTADSVLYPLFLREQEKGWKMMTDVITDDNNDGEPEINRPEEITAGLKTMAESLVGNARLDQIHPVLIKGNKAWHLGENGQAEILLDSVPSSVDFSISHNVAPAREAFGANGCLDCHDAKASFFKGKRVIDMYAADGLPVTINNGRRFGCNPLSFAVNSFHQQILSPLVSIGIIVLVFLVTAHYHRYGPKRIPFVPNSGEVRRFTTTEQAVHNFRLIAFIILGGTGIILAQNLILWQELFFRSPQEMLWVHIISGIVFIVTTAIGAVLWFKDALFASYDRDWVKRIGGYLGYKGDVPAGRFNAGQKAFYWYTLLFGGIMAVTGIILIFKDAFPLSVICLTSTIHNLIGFILIAGVLSHAYLGTVANPGTWRILVDGYVTREWARHHHRQWYDKLVHDGEIDELDETSEENEKDDSDDGNHVDDDEEQDR